MFGGLYRCVCDLYMQYRATTKRVERTRVGYLALGGFVATTLTLTDVLPRFDVAWPAIGNVLGILYLYFLSQTLFRYRLLDLNELRRQDGRARHARRAAVGGLRLPAVLDRRRPEGPVSPQRARRRRS